MRLGSPDIERLVTLLANIGVIASIVFLAWEIRQNTEMVQAQTRDSVTEKQLSLFEWFASSAENIQVRQLGDRGDLEPDSPAAGQYAWMIAGNLRLWENEWYQYRRGLFAADEFEPRVEIWRAMVNRPGVTCAWFMFQRKGYSPDFIAMMDSLFNEQSIALYERGGCDTTAGTDNS